jgi:hypothetical protein
VSSWVIFFSALVVLVSIRLVLHRAVVEAWTRGHLAGRRAGAVAIAIGMTPLALGLWLLVFSRDRLQGVLLVAAWMLGYLPLAMVITEDAERIGSSEEVGPQHS